MRRPAAEHNLVDNRAWLVEQRKRLNLERLSQREELCLDSEETLVSVRLVHEELDGEVGLSATYPRRGAKLKTTVCKERREIEKKEEQAPISLVAIINDDTLEMSPSWDRIVRDPGSKERRNACREVLPALAHALCEAWPTLDSSAQQKLARKHALDLLVLQGDWFLKNIGDEGDAAWTKLCTLPLFSAVDDTYHSVSELARRLKNHDEPVYYIKDDSVRGEPLDKNKIVLALSDFERQRLHRLTFLKTADYSDEWRHEREIIVWQMKARPLPKKGDMAAIHRSDAGLPAGFEGELIIPTSPLDQQNLDDLPRVSFGVHGHVVEDRSISDVFPCAGTLAGPGLDVERHLRWVKLKHDQRKALEAAACELYEGLYEAYQRGEYENWDQRNVMRSYLGAAVVLLVRHVRNYVTKYRPLFRKLEALPLLDLPDGRAISVAVARKERPHELNHLGLWKSRAHEVEERVGEKPEERPATPIPSPPPPVEVEPEKPDPIEEEPEARAIEAEHSPEEARSSEIETEFELPPPPTREELLLEALREELHLVRTSNEHLLSEVNMERLLIGMETKKLAVVCDERGTVVNFRHPMVQIVLEQFDRDRIWLTFLVSAIYSAINHRLEEVTDEEEARFHHTLTELTLSGLTGAMDG